MRLSIIVPIYNKSQYLPTLFQSLLHQGLEANDFEILLVNDGSTDNSETVCIEFIKSHPRHNIRYICQNNGGVSMARNTGLDNATGDYIHFMDSDDTLVDGSYRYILDEFTSTKSDYIGFGFNFMDVRNNASVNSELEAIGGKVIRKASGMELVSDALWPSSCCVGLYKLQFLLSHKVKFPTGISTGEDVWFNFDFFSNNPSCILTSCRPYIYWFRSGSVMTSLTKDKAEKWFHSYNALLFHLIASQSFTPHQEQAIHVHRGVSKVVKHHIEVFLPKSLQFGITNERFKFWSDKFIHDNIIPQPADSMYLKLANFLFFHPSCYPALSWMYRKVFLKFFYKFLHK